jgi:hypothetical protein
MYTFIPHFYLTGQKKMVKNKTTWGERTLTSRKLGIQLSTCPVKSEKEKRKLSDTDKAIIESKAKRMKSESKGGVKGEDENEVKEEEEGQGEDKAMEEMDDKSNVYP